MTHSDLSFRKQVCDYYNHNTSHETCSKFNVPYQTLLAWRKELGYYSKGNEFVYKIFYIVNGKFADDLSEAKVGDEIYKVEGQTARISIEIKEHRF